MATVADSAPSVTTTRHGRCRLWLQIGDTAYTLAPLPGVRHGWRLTVRTGLREGAIYHVTRQPGQHAVCSCADHQERGARCKHLGALTALRLISPPPSVRRPKP